MKMIFKESEFGNNVQNAFKEKGVTGKDKSLENM